MADVETDISFAECECGGEIKGEQTGRDIFVRCQDCGKAAQLL